MVVEARLPSPPLEGQQGTMIGTPRDEIPLGAVPQAAQQHDDRQIDVRPPLTESISTQREVQVIAQHTG